MVTMLLWHLSKVWRQSSADSPHTFQKNLIKHIHISDMDQTILLKNAINDKKITKKTKSKTIP